MTELKPGEYDLTLNDALEGGYPPIHVKVEVKAGETGIGIGCPERDGDRRSWEWRVLIENCSGHLICRVWETAESITDDSTHQIDIEPAGNPSLWELRNIAMMPILINSPDALHMEVRRGRVALITTKKGRA